MQFFQNHSTLLTGGAGQLGLVLAKEPIISDGSLSILLQILVALVTIFKLVIDYLRKEQDRRKNNGNTSNSNSQDNENGAE
jgi:hypothetical protein